MPGAEESKNFIVERIRDPRLFIRGGMRKGLTKRSTFKTIRPYPGSDHRVTIGRLKTTGKTAIQRKLHPKSEAHGRGRKFECRDGRCRRLR